MASNNNVPYDPLHPAAPPSPHTDAYPLPPSALGEEGRFSYYSAQDIGTPLASVRAVPPDLDNLPVPESHLPPGAEPPQRFYGAIDNEPYSRNSFASSSPTMQELGGGPRPGFGGFRDSDYDSVARLRVDSSYGTGATYGGVESPRVSSFGTYRDDPYASTADLPMDDLGHTASDKREMYAAPTEQKRRWLKTLVIGAVVILIIAIAVLVPLYFFVFKDKSTNNNSATGGSSSSSHGSSTASGGKPVQNLPVTGRDGSLITTEDNITFTYSNKFGGSWYYDQNDPFNNNAQAQSYSPPLNTTWKYGVNRIYGVNLGGWLNTEPFISPALYEPYLNAQTPAIDEWTLSVNMAADTANGGLSQLERHYATFITEEDFAMIAGAGLNWVRIPFPYWAVSKFDDEPFLEGTAWKYFLKAIQWARKYGIRINLDLHAVPGSQNAFNHSGKLGLINWLNGVMGIANAQRSLDTIRFVAEFISQPQYSDVVTMFGLINEPVLSTIGLDVIGKFYYQAHNIIRNITGIGEGKGAFISIHDGFLSDDKYAGFMVGSDRIALDTHPYLCFQTNTPDGPAKQALRPCPAWGAQINNSMSAFGFTTAGEWSLGYTDCGLFLNGVGLGTRYEGNDTQFPTARIGSCGPILDWPNWTADYKAGLQQFALASMDALQHSFFWTWKIGNSSITGKVESPHWSYRLGLENGWMPADPRQAIGVCASQGVNVPWNGPLSAWQTGGTGAGTFLSPQSYTEWPPATLTGINNAAQLPMFTPTGTITTLPAPSLTKLDSSATVDAGNGWQDPSDTQGAYASIAGCTYPNGWNAVSVAIPAQCSGSPSKREENIEKRQVPRATITPRP